MYFNATKIKDTRTVNPVTSDTSATDKRWVLFRTTEHWIYPFHCRVKFPTRTFSPNT